MTTDPIPRMPVENPFAANIAALASIFPAAVGDGRIHFDILRQLLGDAVEDGDERYGLHWNGKRAARAFALTPATGTLRPDRADGPDWDTTRNMVVEGDNLEVLKLLRRAYAGRVKLIYIDPPYNTGNDFVYPDDYRDTLGSYARLTGQRDGDGMALTSNGEGGGRFHTNWLNMMYPRLLLARDMLRDDGVIFVSCDDHEESNVVALCNEVMGEHNFVARFVVQTNPRGRSLDRFVAKTFEYLICYARDVTSPAIRPIPKDDAALAEYSLRDDGGDYRLLELRNRNPVFNRANRPNLYFPLHTSPDGGAVSLQPSPEHPVAVLPLNSEGVEGCWTWGRERVERDNALLVARRASTGAWRVFRKDYVPADGATTKEKSLWVDSNLNHENGKEEVRDLFGESPFDFPKSRHLIQRILRLGTGPDDIILDFFAGSGTTGHAVMALNAADGGSRRYVLVQLPEPLDPATPSQRTAAALCDRLGKPRTIAELTKERLRRAGAKLRAAHPDTAIDTGFRVYRLAPSNLKPWDPAPADLVAAVEAAADNILPGRSEDDLLVELMLRTGVDPVTPVETRTIAGVAVHAVDGGVLIACMAAIGANAEDLGEGIAAWHAELAPPRATAFHFRDSGFADAAAKANLAAILRQRLGAAGIARLSAL